MTEWSKITADPIHAPAVAPSAPVAASAPVATTPPLAGPASPASTTRDRRATSRGLRSVVGVSVLAAVLASASTVGLLAATRPPTASSPPAAAAASPAVVQANTTSADELLPDVVAKARLSVVTITADGVSTGGISPFSMPATGVGSGVILTADGYILTNRHVVQNSQSLTVALSDGTEYPAEIVEIADDNDLALIKIDATDLPAATIGDSSALKAGQTAIAIGSPLGTYTETVTKGIISALDRDITVQDETTGRPIHLHNLIQTDAAINPGNSGGALLDVSGALVGINTAIAGNAEGLGFAIPIEDAADLIARAHGTAS
jgi:serine protease Do